MRVCGTYDPASDPTCTADEAGYMMAQDGIMEANASYNHCLTTQLNILFPIPGHPPAPIAPMDPFE